ncbi:triose-phosphate transporter family-domain-containing protein [Globomyces pollinis-pini]|nr:triose-phosphate transporter family-domain-containing protein [Globomyces pollinis-pini]
MVRFYLICICWYASSAVTNSIGKVILSQFKYPVTMTLIQFAFVSLFSFLYSSVFSKLQPPTLHIIRNTFPIAAFQITGHILSTNALTYISVAFSHTIKALSPLFTAFLYKVLYNVNHSMNVYMALLLLTSGVVLVCASNLKFNLIGFLCSLGSTFIFVLQNIVSKKIFNEAALSQMTTRKIDKINMMFYANSIALMIIFPIWFYAEGWSLLLTNELPSVHLLFLLLLKGLTHFCQSILAFSILAMCSPITYSIASLVKRIFVITASIIYFADAVGFIQASGIALTFTGLYLYQRAKREVATAEMQAADRMTSELPRSYKP